MSMDRYGDSIEMNASPTAGSSLFFLNDTATAEIYTLSLPRRSSDLGIADQNVYALVDVDDRTNAMAATRYPKAKRYRDFRDRKSTRLNSSHANISYAVFCLKKKHRFSPLLRRPAPPF